MNESEKEPNREHRLDSNWKDLIKANPDDAIEFFMPELAKERDYAQEPQFRSTEYGGIEGKSDKGRVNTDLCMAVPLKTGETPRALFIIEQQHNDSENFPLRMFRSWYRASDEHRIPVTSLVIYTGHAKPVDNYSLEWQGTSVNFRYNVYSVERVNADDLKRDGRPFALPVLAAKRMLEAAGNPEKRGEAAIEMIGLIKERDLDGKKARAFRKFTSNILQLDKEDIGAKVKEAWKMQFIPASEAAREVYERWAREEGIEEGITRGRQEGLEVARTVMEAFMKAGLPAEQVAREIGLPEVSQILSAIKEMKASGPTDSADADGMSAAGNSEDGQAQGHDRGTKR